MKKTELKTNQPEFVRLSFVFYIWRRPSTAKYVQLHTFLLLLFNYCN